MGVFMVVRCWLVRKIFIIGFFEILTDARVLGPSVGETVLNFLLLEISAALSLCLFEEFCSQAYCN